MSQAYADGTEAPLPIGAKERAYIDQMASEAGLSDSEFVATTVGALGATTGMVLSANPGIRLIDATLGDNLDNLISAADYPAWDTLTETQQASYGSKVNYDSTKYVALMEAFDLNDGFSRFAETGSSGGGFVFTPAESERLHRIGNVGKNWANKVGQSIGELRGLLAPDYSDILYKYLYGSNTSGGNGELTYNGEGMENWPSGQTVTYKNTNVAWVGYVNSYNQLQVYYKVQSLTDVYVLVYGDGNRRFNFAFFSKSPFQTAANTTQDLEQDLTAFSNATLVNNVDGKPYYLNIRVVSLSSAPNGVSQTVNVGMTDSYELYANILYGETGSESGGSGELVPDIQGYPETEIPANTTIYYPIDGIQPETSWVQYVTVQRPDNPFNPDDQTSTPEWQQETKQNIQGLQGIRFDKLFPFCLYYDLQKFWQKVQAICGIQTSESGTITTQASSAYDEIELRFYIPDVMDDTWTFDLEPLRNLLLIIKPFMLVFLIGVEIISLIMLWKGILTGQ